MKISNFETFRNRVLPTNQSNHPNNDTIKGLLLNTYIKKDTTEKIEDFNRISNELLIPSKIELPKEDKKEEKKENFDYKKALKPVLITTLATIATLGAVSFATKRYSSVLANKEDFIRPGDLARNVNILEEPHFAAYRMLRNPNAKNVAGFIGVGLMSAITLICKNFFSAVKEIWIKKQNCDIEHDLQENLIQVETDAFSGKLNVVNTLLSDTTKYFKEVLSNDNKTNVNFKNYVNFKGVNKDKNNENDEKKKNLKTFLALSAGVIGFVGISFILFKNYQKTLKNLDTFTQKYEHEKIKAQIADAINNSDKSHAIKKLTDLFKVINAKDETMKENFSKIKGITPDEIKSAIQEVQNAQIYAQAPEALGGISEKIQYYCYINEDRGHLYNWILNPENKFNKYLFICFSAISAIGYIAKETADAVREVIVNRENSKSELSLKKKLVDTEIRNFKAKKMSAINPMIDNFICKLEQNRPKEELKHIAENILIEIKNGPPYVYS